MNRTLKTLLGSFYINFMNIKKRLFKNWAFTTSYYLDIKEKHICLDSKVSLYDYKDLPEEVS